MSQRIQNIERRTGVDVSMLGYLLITALPKGASLAHSAQVLVRLSHMTQEQAENLLEQEVPIYVARILVAQGPDVVASLRRQGFGADWIPHSELQGHMAARQVQSIVPALGAPQPMYLVQLWREKTPIGMLASQVCLLVRGRTRTTTIAGSAPKKFADGSARIITATVLLGPIGVLAASMMGSVDEPSAGVVRRSTNTEYLDIHLRDGGLLRCDGSRFHFGALGGAKGYSDTENMDKLATQVGHAASNARIDINFSKRKVPPPVLLDFRAATGARGDTRTPEVFFVYSAWLASLALREIAW